VDRECVLLSAGGWRHELSIKVYRHDRIHQNILFYRKSLKTIIEPADFVENANEKRLLPVKTSIIP
jgi:hypothetical protein